ncbi:MAG: GTP-binding protein [Opitutales bacterium]
MEIEQDSTSLVYLIYGIPGSGRREALFDLIEGAVAPGAQVLYFRPEEEPPSPFDEQLEALENVRTQSWRLSNEHDRCRIQHGAIEAAPDRIFFLAPGNGDPADMAEALKHWVDHNPCSIARIITVTHCSFLHENRDADAWFNACIHFSDIVLLNRRENVGNKWLRDFETRYKKACYPCRFLPVKKGRVDNPPEVLEPEARRVSLYFDELPPIEEDGLDEEDRPEDTKPDKFIARLESGRRACPIPDIRTFLE